MTSFVVNIEDAAQLAGISWAREQYNASLPKDEAGNPVDPLADDTAYVTFVMSAAADSYARQKYESEWRAAAESGGTPPPPPAGEAA